LRLSSFDRIIYTKANSWNPTIYPQDYIECVAFVVHSYALTSRPYTGRMGNANLWSGYTAANKFNVYTSGISSVAPSVGDLAVWDRMHIGIITEINTQTREITITQGNLNTIKTIKTYAVDQNGRITIAGNDPFNHWLKRK